MKNPPSTLPKTKRQAATQLRFLLKNRHRLNQLPTPDFINGWQSLFFLAPGLHPDESDHPDGGWPLGWMSIAKEAFRHASADELDINPNN